MVESCLYAVSKTSSSSLSTTTTSLVSLFSSFRYSSSSSSSSSETQQQQQQEEVADISPPTAAEARIYSEQLIDVRVERFREDMYALPAFNPLVMILTMIGFLGFFSTWGYFVATPVYLAHVGKRSSGDEGEDAEELD